MPLTDKGTAIKSALTKEYGEKKGEQVLYAGKNKGTFTGIDRAFTSTYRGMNGDQQPPLVTTPNAGLPGFMTTVDDDD
jgi:hypothetical protein